MKKPEVSILFALYLLFAFLVMTAITIYQDKTIAQQRILIRQLFQDLHPRRTVQKAKWFLLGTVTAYIGATHDCTR